MLTRMNLPKVHNLNQIMRKHQIKPEWGPFYNKTGLDAIQNANAGRMKSCRIFQNKED